MMHEDGKMMLSRRSLVTGAAAFAAFAALPVNPAMASLISAPRSLAFRNLHTDELLNITYFENGRYQFDALKEINHVLRDHRTDEVKEIDPTLLDLLASLQRKLRVKEPYQIISAYRSPKTNAKLREEGHGVALHSMHTEGKAVDIRLKTRNIGEIRTAALKLGQGGVGYYLKSNFVHVDTGRVRKW